MTSNIETDVYTTTGRRVAHSFLSTLVYIKTARIEVPVYVGLA